MAKVRFWDTSDFYGIDFTPLRKDALDEVFAQPVVGNFDHRILMAESVSHFVDFQTVSLAELKDIVIPITWVPCYTGIVHGIAGWFDIDLCGLILSTAPNAERTHWQQVRFMLRDPLAINAFEPINGWFRMVVNSQRSYDVTVELTSGEKSVVSDPYSPWVTASPIDCEDTTVKDVRIRRGKWALQEQTYWYSNEVLGSEYNKPENLSLYPSVGAENTMLDVAPAVGFGQPTNI
ncbi:Histone-arginine methyltransferase carm1 [Rhizoclosmatium hyalinum]|nr:Histone-arginine methyltransferase carm1 [Rhizoclosmatium hyalinum]